MTVSWRRSPPDVDASRSSVGLIACDAPSAMADGGNAEFFEIVRG
jgi:hypothetical protein